MFLSELSITLLIFINLIFNYFWNATRRKLWEAAREISQAAVYNNLNVDSNRNISNQSWPKFWLPKLATDVTHKCNVVTKIKLVKPDKVAAIENSLIAAAQQGKLRNKISEQELVSMLESQTKTESKITVILR